jgi:hypothetical protein
MHHARDKVRSEAAAHSLQPCDLSATLLVAIAAPSFLVVGQIGDGGAVVRSRDGAFHLLAQPQKGEYSNQTVFVTSRGALDDAQIAVWPRPHHTLCLFSDGLEQLALEGLSRLLYGTGGLRPYDPFLRPLCQWIARSSSVEVASERLDAFLASPTVREHTSDDLTLLIAFR